MSYPVDRKSLFFENPKNVLLFLVQSLHDGYYFFFISASKKFQKVNITFWNFFYHVFGVRRVNKSKVLICGRHNRSSDFDAYIISSEILFKVSNSGFKDLHILLAKDIDRNGISSSLCMSHLTKHTSVRACDTFDCIIGTIDISILRR